MYGTVALKYFNVINGITVGNITLDATTGNATVTNLAVTGNANLTAAANVALGSNSNVKLTGGSSGQYLQTDGAGNLSWQSISSATAIANGTSNVSIPAANGNVVVSVNGVANIATFTSNAVFRGSYGLTGIISQSNTAPASPQNGDQWYNTFNGILFEYLDDGTSSQWVDISSLPLPNISTVNASAVLNNVQSTGTYFPAFISSTANGNYALSSNTAFSANLANGALIATTFVGALSGAATSATTAGTVTTAAQPNITSVGTLTSLGVTGNISAGNVSATTFTGALSGAATTAGTVTTNAQPNITSVGTLTSLTVTGNASAGNLSTSGILISTGNANVGNLNTAGTINAFQTITGSQFIATATVSAPMVTSSTTKVANLNADLLDGFDTSSVNIANTVVVRNSDGSFGANVITATLIGSANTAGTVTTAAQPNITSVGTLTSATVTGNISAGNVSATTFTGALSGAATTAGTVTTNAQPNITSVGTLTSVSVTGNVAAGNLTTTGVLSVTGTGVSSIAGNLDMTSNTIINLATPTNSTDAATKQYVDDVAQGLNVHPSCNAATTTTLASISGGTVTYNNGTAGVGATLTTTGSYTTIDGVTLSDGMRILVKNEVTTANNGIYVRTSATVLTRATDFDTAVEIAGGDFTFITAGTVYNSTGWVQIDEVTTVGTDPIVWEQFSGAGTYQAGTGLTLTGSTFSVNASQTQVTAVGTLTSLGVTGNISAGNVSATTFTGALTGAATTAGTVTTAAQPNITSVGTLTSLAVTGNISAGNVSATTFTGALTGAATTAGTVTTAAQPNITSVSTSFSGLTFVANAQITMSGAGSQISGVNLISANSFSGNGSSITGINASSIASGTLAQARLANSTITFGNTTLTLGGTTTTVAGLTSVTSTTFVGALTGAATSATTAGTVTTAAQPNITSTGTLTGLTVSGTTSLSTASGYVSVGGTSQFNSFKYNQDGGALGSTVGNQVRHATYYSSSTNADYLEITNTRYANGGDWTTAGSRLQQKIDATWMGFIQFNGAVQGGITFGTGLSSTAPNAVAGKTVMDSNGHFYPLTDNSLTLGASGQRWSTAFATTVQTTALTTGANSTAGTVTGNWTLTAGSRWQATYADLAEKYTADDTYEPGTVLLFGGEQEVTLANAFDSTKVAGVVTTNPAYSMNAMLEAEYIAEIALQGRVPCKVIGPIEKGDLMVSASNGHATANNDARAGTIIGKALENFNGDFGVIEVAVGRF